MSVSFELVVALIGLTGTLLTTIIVSTWKSSALASKLLASIQKIEEKEKEQDARIGRLDDIPALKVSIDQTKDAVTRCLSMFPQLQQQVTLLTQRLIVVETQQKHSKEWRREVFRSRPDREDDEDES